MNLDGATVLLTGSNRGIGHALLSRFAREPVRLLAGVRDPADALREVGARRAAPVT